MSKSYKREARLYDADFADRITKSAASSTVLINFKEDQVSTKVEAAASRGIPVIGYGIFVAALKAERARRASTGAGDGAGAEAGAGAGAGAGGKRSREDVLENDDKDDDEDDE